jgi:hypothetical protein
MCLIAISLHCGSDKGNNPPYLPADERILGTWSFSLPNNPDTTFYIVLDYDSNFTYRINVNINHSDTMHWERGVWTVDTNTSSQPDTVWMNRQNCRQIDPGTKIIVPIDCGNKKAGIKVNISQSASNKTQWIIPLGDFRQYLPPGIIPSGLTLPPGAFIKE